MEVTPEEEAGIKVGVVQWRVMSCQGFHHLLRITHLLFTKVCVGNSNYGASPCSKAFWANYVRELYQRGLLSVEILFSKITWLYFEATLRLINR